MALAPRRISKIAVPGRRLTPAGLKLSATPEAPSTFDVVLKDAGAGKLNVVKIVKTLTGMGLKEAKDLVDALGVVKADVSQEEAEAIKAQLVEAGATVEIRAHAA